MNLSGIYRKTEKGAEEIKNRRHLPTRFRALLIMVDGKTTVSEILEKASVMDDAHQMLQLLVEQGFIEEVPGTAPAAPAPAVSAADQDLAGIKRLVIRKLYDALGPNADFLTVKVEEAKTQAEIEALAEKSRDAIRTARGSSLAESFWNDISAHLQA